MTKFNVGDKVRFIGSNVDFSDNVTSGEIYVINEVDGDGWAYFFDDRGTVDYRSFITRYKEHLFEVVSEQPVEASPSVIELLSNLALRLAKVEAGIKPKEADGVANETPTQSDTVDNVNSPQHYRHGRFETIELIEDITKKYDDGFVAYCVGNAVKYADRAPFKHGSPSEDLRKAAWYLTRAAEHTDGK